MISFRMLDLEGRLVCQYDDTTMASGTIALGERLIDDPARSHHHIQYTQHELMVIDGSEGMDPWYITIGERLVDDSARSHHHIQYTQHEDDELLQLRDDGALDGL
jgi:hypothetical protein